MGIGGGAAGRIETSAELGVITNCCVNDFKRRGKGGEMNTVLVVSLEFIPTSVEAIQGKVKTFVPPEKFEKSSSQKIDLN